jgi:hypothetical protein
MKYYSKFSHKLSYGEFRRPSLPTWSAEYDGRSQEGGGGEERETDTERERQGKGGGAGGLIYGPIAGQHLTYGGDMLVNERANEAAELTTKDPSSKSHALCVSQTTDRVTQKKQTTIALRNSLKHRGKWTRTTYYGYNTKQTWRFPTECIYRFRMVLRIKIHYFPTQH